MKEKQEQAMLRRMADMLRTGATMLTETCPECKVPLFRLKTGEVICPSCNRRVYIVKEGEEVKVMGSFVMAELERTLYSKLRDLDMALRGEKDPDKMYELSRAIIACLEALERIRKLQSSSG